MISDEKQNDADVTHPARVIARRAAQLDARTLAAHLHRVTVSQWTCHLPSPSSPASETGRLTGELRHINDTTAYRLDLITNPTLLSSPTREKIFSLFQSRIQASYELNASWRPDEKKDEMFDAAGEGRWILLWEQTEAEAEEEKKMLVGFLLWRFDVEESTKAEWIQWDEGRRQAEGLEGKESQSVSQRIIPLPGVKRGPGGKARLRVKRAKVERLLPVGYCYELHLSSARSSSGLGSTLLTLLEMLSQRTGMAKTMLTCWRCNTSALRFYLQKRSGWGVDGISPRGVEGDGEDGLEERGEQAASRRKGYVILSCPCKPTKEMRVV